MSENSVTLQQLLKAMNDQGASDLHLATGSPPLLRIDGAILPLKLAPLGPTDTKQLCYSVLSEEQRRAFERDCELDFAFGVKGLARYRANFFVQRGAVSAVFRAIPFRPLTLEELALPQAVAQLGSKPHGLVLLTGPTGAGKSTTLAALVDKINTDKRQHIVTVEDPIEYLHPHKRSLVSQREVGSDTKGFAKALKQVLRQDPDVILVGEMRDAETIEATLTLAETGHLVFATLHTSGAVQTILRIVDSFPPHQQGQVKTQLSFALEGIVSQLLLPKASGAGRALALEILIPNPAIRNLIRDDKAHQIYSQMQVGQGANGMQTMNQSLYLLCARRAITVETALASSPDPDELRLLFEAARR